MMVPLRHNVAGGFPVVCSMDRIAQLLKAIAECEAISDNAVCFAHFHEQIEPQLSEIGLVFPIPFNPQPSNAKFRKALATFKAELELAQNF